MAEWIITILTRAFDVVVLIAVVIMRGSENSVKTFESHQVRGRVEAEHQKR